MNDSKWYVMLDAMAIQRHVFETGKTRIIVGASLALARWQNECKTLCTEGDVITSAGGNVLAVFDDIGKAEDFRKQAVGKAPPGMEIAWAICDRQKSDGETWQALQVEIACFKAGNRAPDHYLNNKDYDLPLPECNFCGKRPKFKSVTEGSRKRKICNVCNHYYNLGSGIASNHDGDTPLEKLYKKAECKGVAFPEDLEELVRRPGARGEESDLLAVVVIDLNEMGNTIKEIVSKKGFEELKGFSTTLEEKLTTLLTTLIGNLSSEVSWKSKDTKGNDILRLRPLLFGGDDIVMAMPTPLWPEFVKRTFEAFEKEKIPACAGIAVAKHDFPLNRLTELAEKLCANAKMVTRHNKAVSFALDWHLHQEAAYGHPAALRRRKWLKDIDHTHFLATRRPYALEDFKALCAEAKKFETAYANRKLYSLYKVLLAGGRETRDTLVYEFLRNDDEGLSKYDSLWLEVAAVGGDYPLWEKVDRNLFDNLQQDLHDTRFADMLELMFTSEAQEEGGADQ
jgi:hypothetical protein